MQSLLGSHFHGVYTLEGGTQILRDSERPPLPQAQTERDETHKANYSQMPLQFIGQCLKFYKVFYLGSDCDHLLQGKRASSCSVIYIVNDSLLLSLEKILVA